MLITILSIQQKNRKTNIHCPISSLSPVIKGQKARANAEQIKESIKKGFVVTPVTDLCPVGPPSLQVGYLDEPGQIIRQAS